MDVKVICYLLIICVVSTQSAKKKSDLDVLRGFLKMIVKSNFDKKNNNILIGEINTSGCRDDYSRCSLYKDYCSHPTIKLYCKQTCSACPTPAPTKPPCNDIRKDCASLKNRYCESQVYKGYMTKYCGYTCGYCGGNGVQQIGCGVAKRRENQKSNVIIGGEDAQKGFYPWQVAIYYENDFLCGGSLIDKKHVLTAAHCFKYLSTDLSLYRVVLGDNNRGFNEGSEVERDVRKITQHPDYQYESDTHDVAIIEMTSSITYGEDINAICLPKSNEVLPVGSKCFMSGWGKIRNDQGSVAQLQHLAIPIVDREHCKQRNTFNGHIVNDRMICAGYNDGINYSSGCHGDSGGPLACEQPDGSWKLFGVVSWGSPQCNGLDRYTVFARVSKYISWINRETSS